MYRKIGLGIVVLLVLGLGASHIFTTHAATLSVTIWVQAQDSCQRAIPFSQFRLTSNYVNIDSGLTIGRTNANDSAGVQRYSIAYTSGDCPNDRGDCAKVFDPGYLHYGCTAFTVPFPKMPRTYQFSQIRVWPNFMPCTGGSACHGVTGSVTVYPNGQVVANVVNIQPDRTLSYGPASGPAYTGTQTDPIVVHNFELSDGTQPSMWCDAQNLSQVDADDHLTGTKSSHCENADDND